MTNVRRSKTSDYKFKLYPRGRRIFLCALLSNSGAREVVMADLGGKPLNPILPTAVGGLEFGHKLVKYQHRWSDF